MDENQIAYLLNRPIEERFTWRGRKTLSLAWISFLVLSAFFYVLVFHTERYFNHDGLGDDGAFYGTWIQYFSTDIPSMGLHSYSAQRLFPVYFVWKLLSTFHLPLIPPYIVRTFQWMNFFSIVFGFAAWNITAKELSLTRAGYIFGTASIFMSCAVLKWIPFDPVLDDALAFGLASIAMMAFLKRRYILLAIVTLVGAFTWPSFVAVGAALLFFPRRSTLPPESSSFERVVGDLIAGVFAGWVTVAAGHLSSFHPPNSVIPAALGPFRLSCTILGLTVFFGMRSILRIRQIASEVIQRTGGALFSRTLAVIVMVTFVKGVRWISSAASMALPQPPHVTYETFTDLTLFLGVQRPGAFIVSHAVFFGPIILVLFLNWQRVCDVAARFGAAPVLLLGLALLMGLNSESRRAVAFVPVLLPLVAVAVADFPWDAQRLGGWVVLSLFCSRVWHTIVQFPRLDGDSLAPMMGPWMPNDYMVSHTLISIVLLFAFAKMAKGATPSSPISLVAISPTVGG